MRENRMRENVVELALESRDSESVVDQEVRSLVRQACEFKLQLAGFNERRIDVETIEISLVKISHESHAAAKASASDIQQAMLGQESRAHEEIELQLADFIP